MEDIIVNGVFSLERLDSHKKWLQAKEDGERLHLSDADLRGVNLRSADLQDANLRGVNLRSADLRSADLQFADLQNADLQFANLQEVNLRFTDLQGANLYGANLYGANLQEVNLRFADLRFADLRGADLRYATLPDGVPVIENINAAVADAITAENLDMGSWHSECGTTHCRAGHAVILAGPEGRALEKRLGTGLLRSITLEKIWLLHVLRS